MTSKLDNITPPGYTKPNEISEGAFGQVLKVTHERSGIEYAVKVLPILKERDKERVSREVEMLTRFAHPRIVRLHESIDMGGHHAIVMELGTRSLNDLISEYESRNALIPLPLTVMILVDICEGLLWMHTHSSGSTAHGDLKPENVLLRVNNRAFLCDLGGSAPLDQQMTSTIGELGTFEYNSPERVMDSKGMATPASDVWSLGVLAYRMATGKSLFEGLTLPQLCRALDQFSESRIPTTIPSLVRDVLLKLLEPNVALRATTTALFEGGLLERMLGPETPLSKMKSTLLATRVDEIKQSSSDAKMKEKTMKLDMEKQKLLEETKTLERQLRLLQMSLQRTCERNIELEKEELAQRGHLLTTRFSPLSIKPEVKALSHSLQMPALQFLFGSSAFFDVSGNTVTQLKMRKNKNWCTTLFAEPFSDGVVSVAITVLALPEEMDGLMFGLVDTLSRQIEESDKLGDAFPNSIALALRSGTLHVTLPSTLQREKTIPIYAGMGEGDRVVLEVDMDARPRTAVFIINGTVPLTFVSGLPPSIQFGFSMKNKGVSVRLDGISRLNRATPFGKVKEIKWNLDNLEDSEDMYMNGMRSSVLTVQTHMPSLVFQEPSLFRVEDNRIARTYPAAGEAHKYFIPTWSSFFLAEPISEGIVAFSITPPVKRDMFDTYFFGLIDGTAPIPKELQNLGKLKSSIGLSSEGELHFVTSEGHQKIDVPFWTKLFEPDVVEVNMDSNPRTAQFFANGESVNVVVVGLPESVRVGFSVLSPGVQIRFDRITNLVRASPFTDLMEEFEWPTTKPPHPAESEKTGTSIEKKKRQFPTMKLPELLFTHKSHFIVRNNVLTRTEKGTDEKGRNRPSTVLFSEPITKGVVSVTFVVLTLAESTEDEELVTFGLLDSSVAVPDLGQTLDSVGLSTSGDINVFNQIKLETFASWPLSEKDRVVVEVNMDSTPRTVQFFVNGKTIGRYVSGIPDSVRIGFSADVMGTSLQITSIVRSTQPTPLADTMEEIKWTGTEQSLKERAEKHGQPIRREPEGSIPALLCRNWEHFKIEGNVITRTSFGSNGLDTPFSTVMLDGVVTNTIQSVTITILALHQTGRSFGVVMVGGLCAGRPIPKSPYGLGFTEKESFLPRCSDSFALCSSDGTIHRSGGKMNAYSSHSLLRVGDQVVLEVNTRSQPEISRFFVNGKAGQNNISCCFESLTIGFSLAGPGTSIRIDAVTELDQPTDKSKLQPSRCPPLPPPPRKVAAREHPDYQPFFAKLKDGKSSVVLAMKMRLKGLNPEALSDPDILV
ncbi:putative Mitogen-activated protein kinase kinase 2 [Blattamonas nauphoetae]|uniref:non-specific serine/threonine protein kinase n=1 Tax=Blattamonas nauphoetae TaxID=2049346 RepID=A0ABQ9WZ11_9EUKA|nr:putative Mitogen-activated protein kinase kinase 2 [Blattamonas nauphoetae]